MFRSAKQKSQASGRLPSSVTAAPIRADVPLAIDGSTALLEREVHLVAERPSQLLPITGGYSISLGDSVEGDFQVP